MKKIILIIICSIITFIVVGIGCVFWVVKANDAKNNDNPVYYGDEGSTKKALIVYQNGRSSYNKDVAENIASGLSDKGYYVTTNQPGDYLKKNLSEYDLVIFGSPVYAAQISSVLQEYAKSVDNFGKARVICYCVGNNPNDDELKKFDDLFDKKIDGSFKIVKRKFDSDKDIAIEKVSKVID